MSPHPDSVAWEVRGDPGSPPLLLIPPLGRDRTAWDAQTPALAKRFCCVLFDPRGTGESRHLTGYATADMADDARTVLDAAGVGPAHVIGWSLGSAAAMVFALDHPGQVRSLSLLTPWARTDAHLRTAFSLLRELGTQVSPESAELATLWLILSRAAVNAAGEALAKGAEEAVGAPGYPDVTAMTGYLDAGIDHDVLARLPGITAPALVVGGANDRLVDVEHAREVAAALPAPTLHVLEGAGATHALPVEMAAEVTDLLVRFVEGVESRRAPGTASAPSGTE